MKRLPLNTGITLLALMLAFSIQARADLVRVEFSGVWSGYAGLAQDGESFSGTISWETVPFTGNHAFSLSTFPELTMSHTPIDKLDEVYFTVPWVPFGRPTCDPEYWFDGSPRDYIIEILPTSARVICHGLVYTGTAVATNYVYTKTVTSPTAHTPEPRYLGLIGLAVVGIVVKRRSSMIEQRRM